MGSYKAVRNDEGNNEQVSEQDLKKAQDQRNVENNKKNILAAAEVASNVPNPYVKAAGTAVKGLDKVTGGKSTELLGKAMNTANKITPGGQEAQNLSNKLGESGASDLVRKGAQIKNGMSGGGGNAPSGGNAGAASNGPKPNSATVKNTPDLSNMKDKFDSNDEGDSNSQSKKPQQPLGASGKAQSTTRSDLSSGEKTEEKKGLLNLSSGAKDKAKGAAKDAAKEAFKKLPLAVRIKIIVICGAAFLFMLLCIAVFAQDDDQNQSLTDGSAMQSKGGGGYSGSGTYNGEVMTALEDIGNWYIANVHTYQQSACGNRGSGARRYYETPFGSRKFGDDCTEFVTLYMSFICGSDLPESYSGAMIYPNGSWAQSASNCGWKAYTSDSIGSLQPGDVLIAHSGALYSTKGQHAEVYVDESHTFGWGSCKSAYPSNNAISTSNFGGHVHFQDGGHDYITVFRYEGA